MNKKTTIMGLVLVLALGAGIIVWQSSKDGASGEPIRVTMHLWPGYVHSYIALEKGCFKEERINVKLIINEGIDDNLKFFEDGKADAAFGLQSDAMLLAAKGFSHKIVYIADFSNGGDVIVSKLGIKTISGLKGKRVSVDKLNGFNHIFLVELLRLNGLSESDVTVVPVPAAKVPDYLAENKIDAGQTWEPYHSQALAQGNRLLASTRDAPGIVTDVLMFRTKFIDQRPGDVRKFVKCLFAALKFRTANENESYAIMSKSFNIPAGSLKGTIQGNIFPDLAANIRAFEKTEDATSLFRTGKFISDFFVRKGVIKKPIDLDKLHASEIVGGLK